MPDRCKGRIMRRPGWISACQPARCRRTRRRRPLPAATYSVRQSCCHFRDPPPPCTAPLLLRHATCCFWLSSIDKTVRSAHASAHGPLCSCAGKQRSLKMWLAGGGPANQRSGSQVLESEDSLPETPPTALAASESGVPAPSQAQNDHVSADVSLSRLSGQREPSGGTMSAQPKQQGLLPRPAAPAAAGRKGKRPASAAGEG